MILSCIWWLYLIEAHTWNRLDWYSSRAACEIVAKDANKNVIRKPGQIGPSWVCLAPQCGEAGERGE